MTKYVCGFLFDSALELVVLIEKVTPAWQKGFWNGVGGKIEPGETPIQAMTREFNEEAGLEVTNWLQFCTLRGPQFEVHFFHTTMDSEQIMKVKTMTKETLGIWSLSRVSMWSFPLLTNIRWLLPMALLSVKDKRKEVFDIYVENPDNPEK